MGDPVVDPGAGHLDLSHLSPATLEEVVSSAAATVRVDRKYIVPTTEVLRLAEALADEMRVLAVGGRRWTTYRSTYFDTPDLLTCRAHVQQRRRRWKVRSRLYVEDRFCRLEIKVRDGSGLTTKQFHPVLPADYGRLTAAGEGFLRDELHRRGFLDVGPVTPSLEVTYRRATLADLARAQRVTLDTAVRTDRHGRTVHLDPDRVIVETKGGARPGVADRLLLAGGHRPRSFSKYTAGIVLTDPRIADNDVRRMVGRELHLGGLVPASSTPESSFQLESA